MVHHPKPFLFLSFSSTGIIFIFPPLCWRFCARGLGPRRSYCLLLTPRRSTRSHQQLTEVCIGQTLWPGYDYNKIYNYKAVNQGIYILCLHIPFFSNKSIKIIIICIKKESIYEAKHHQDYKQSSTIYYTLQESSCSLPLIYNGFPWGSQRIGKHFFPTCNSETIVYYASVLQV